ncbi:MAG TPA: glycosyltransferase [Vicinamibacterales bacterium]|nr:glycosyltransferase [Vicinamibacterales bacterium]
MRTAVIVLGDLGRSPRMQYHAVSLAAAGGDVDLIGLEGAAPIHAVSGNPRIRCHRLADRAFAGRARGGIRRFVLSSALRAAGQAVRLFGTLMRIPKPDLILVQNPPAVPGLSIAWLVAKLRGARFVIDWHNLSHTIAAVKVGEHHRAVKSLARAERRWARRADGHLAVSQALADWLAREYRITAVVTYDRPSAAFAQPSASAASALWDKLAAEHRLGSSRPPIVVCPTSWSPDEDFDLLLEALERAERMLMKSAAAPASTDRDSTSADLAVLLTGRGAMRESFEHRAARRHFKAIAVKTVWLEPADYPTLVGMADLGLCLHQSSSGLDLPMKLADLRGAGVPVAAYDYAPVLGEVMTTGREGVTFRDPGDLASLLVAVATRSVMPDSALARSRDWLAQNPPERWDSQWDASARRVLIA